MNSIFKTVPSGAFRTREEYLRCLAADDTPMMIRLTNDYAFRRVFKNKYVAKGFLLALLHLTEEEIVDLEITDPFEEGEDEEEKEGILDIRIHMQDGRRINLEMQNRSQSDWRERTLFYNCRMFLDGENQGMRYRDLESCIHVGILTFQLMKSSGFHHVIQLMDRDTGEIYSDKFLFHVIELKKLNVAPREEDEELYRWAQMIAAESWEAIDMATKGNVYMEHAKKEMQKINMSRNERYLYLRREMAEMDLRSQLRDATDAGRLAGEERINKLYTLLMEEGRDDDLKRAMKEREYREELFRQYQF